jgi:hypothetical protein
LPAFTSYQYVVAAAAVLSANDVALPPLLIATYPAVADVDERSTS